MHSTFRDDDIFEINMSLRCKVKSQARTIKEFKSGERYLKIQEDHRRVINGYIREIKRLKKELAGAHAQAVTVRKIWTEECGRIWEQHLSEVAKKNAEIRRLEEKTWMLRRRFDDEKTSMELKHADEIYEKDRVIRELENKLKHAEALLGRDSTNTNLPTGMTPPGKKKHNPNSREKSGRSKGGQHGHKKHELEPPGEDEITGVVDHKIDDGAGCPVCGSENLVLTGEFKSRYEIDVEINVKKTRHDFWLYECADCGETVWCGMDQTCGQSASTGQTSRRWRCRS